MIKLKIKGPKSDAEIICLSNISTDTGGVTLGFRTNESLPPDYQPWIFSEQDRIKTYTQLRKLFPGRHIEHYYFKLRLGEFIDLLTDIS